MNKLQVTGCRLLVFVQRCLGSPELRLRKEQNMFKNRKKKIKKYVEKYKNKQKQTNKQMLLFFYGDTGSGSGKKLLKY